jgi:hypothetical protein
MPRDSHSDPNWRPLRQRRKTKSTDNFLYEGIDQAFREILERMNQERGSTMTFRAALNDAALDFIVKNGGTRPRWKPPSKRGPRPQIKSGIINPRIGDSDEVD